MPHYPPEVEHPLVPCCVEPCYDCSPPKHKHSRLFFWRRD
jgi:hypothetical protein